MKRLSVIMLALLMVIASLMVSCDNNSNQIKDEVVEVRFGTKEEGRGLSASVPLEPIDDASLTWYYKAIKVSQPDFVTGAAVKERITLGEPIAFSQGKWDFELMAEKNGKEVYWGKMDGVLITKANSPKTIIISVSPSIEGVNGAVQFNNVKIQKYSTDTNTIATTAANTITFDGNPVTLVDGNATLNDIAPGSHEVFVAYIANVDGNEIIYASETIYITVYSGRTTIISGNVNEEVGSADIGVIATSAQVTETVTIASDTTITAAVAPSNATAPTGENNKVTTVTFPAGALSSTSDTVSAILSVDTQSIDNNITISDGSTAVAGINVNLSVNGSPVTKFNDEYVVITTYIAKGLSNVKVIYNGNGAQPIASDVRDTNVAAELSTDVGSSLGYNKTTGLLRFKTNHFSEFNVAADVICFDPASNTGYSTIQAAINDAPTDGSKKTIKLLNNVSAGGCFEFNGVSGKNIVLDLNGKTYTFAYGAVGSTGHKSQAMHLEKDNALLVKNGTLNVKEGNESIKMLIQNYCDLTLDSVVVDGTNLAGSNPYTMSNNHGNVVITGGTEIIAKEGGYAFDVYYWPSNNYADGVSVTLDENFTGTISGTVQYGSDGTDAGKAGIADNAKLVIKSGTIEGAIDCYGLGADSKTGIYISGGNFKENPSSFVDADEFNVIKSGDYWIIVDKNGVIVMTALELQSVLTTVTSAGSGDNTVIIGCNIELADGEQWKPARVDGYHGAGVVTVEGNGHTIKGLNAPLFAGGFAGNSGIIVKDLTLEKSIIDDTYADQGLGGFICSIDSMPEIELNNCHLKNSTITSTGGARVGGLIGWTAGYNNPNDGPVDTFVTVTDCSVENCTITAAGSVGAIIGHAGGNPATFHTIEDCTVTGTTLKSIDDGGWRVGVVVGTANIGEVTISGITESDNTLTQTGKTAPEHSNLYGRFVPYDTGKLTIEGTVITK